MSKKRKKELKISVKKKKGKVEVDVRRDNKIGLFLVFGIILLIIFSLVSFYIPLTGDVISNSNKKLSSSENIPGFSEVLEEKSNGYLVELRDEPLLKKAIQLKRTKGSSAEILGEMKSHSEKINQAQTNVENDIKSKYKEAKISRKYKIVSNVIFVEGISEEGMEAIKKENSNILSFSPNYEVHANLIDSVPLINADDVWQLDINGNYCPDTGLDCLTGKDISIAIIDSGVDYTHSDLGGCFGNGCKVVGGWDFVNSDGDPMDDNGHGTHCASIAAGSGNGGLKGVAPDAKIYAYKVLDLTGSGSYNNILGAIERAIDPNQDGDFSDQLDIISMSLGTRCGTYNSLCGPDDILNRVVDNSVDSGIIVVVAAGNSGPNQNTIISPGTARKAISVGATDKSDNLAGFSSSGPVTWRDQNGNSQILIKPDIVAPGVSINAAKLGGGYIVKSGTSMATPHVAGAVALIKQANPNWGSEGIKNLLMSTAIDLGFENNEQGAGRIDVANAVMSNIVKPCKDSDFGLNFNYRGFVNYYGAIYTDLCLVDGKTLIEYSCSNEQPLITNNLCSGKCFSGRCVDYPSTTCIDSDIRKTNTKGTVVSIKKLYTDKCKGTTQLKEQICFNGTRQEKIFFGLCFGGKLITETPTSECTDYDGGDIYTEGVTFYKMKPKLDVCVNVNTLKEYVCSNGKISSQKVVCPLGCGEGRCVLGV